jgi:hypothetical protein
MGGAGCPLVPHTFDVDLYAEGGTGPVLVQTTTFTLPAQ